MAARPLLVRLHRYAGLATALFLVVAGLTGCVIAFHDELDGWLNPDFFHAEATGPRLSASDQVQRVEHAFPAMAVTYLPLDEPPGRTADVRVAPRTGAAPDGIFYEVFLDPVTGRITGTREWGACCFSREHLIPFLYRLHYTLAVPGAWGLWLMGIVSLVWTLDCIVSFFLTLPRAGPFWRKWRIAWVVKPHARFHRLNVDLHRASGLWLWLVLFVVALSGVALNLPFELFRPALALVTPLSPLFAEHHVPARHGRALSFDGAIAAARKIAVSHQWPSQPVGVSRDSAGGTFTVGLLAPGADLEAGLGASWLTLDDRTGVLLLADVRGHGTAGDEFFNAQYWLHSGRIAGLPGRILVSLTALSVAMLSITGLYIWWRKRRAAIVQRQRRRRSAALPPDEAVKA